MKALLVLTLMLDFIVSLLALPVPADAQSFYKRKNKYRRSYIATAITGAILRPARPGITDDFRMYGPAMYHDESANITQKDILEERARQQRAQNRAALVAWVAQAEKRRIESFVLGNQIVEHEYRDTPMGR